MTGPGPVVGGLDGCPAGWVLVTVPAAGPLRGVPEVTVSEVTVSEVTVIADLGPVLAALESGRMVAAAIDIPIGLPSRGPRACDTEARRLIGPRRSSVFPAPVRSVLGARTYGEATDLSRRASGRGVSKQLFNILPKVREVDELQSRQLQDRLFEMHPELSFTVLAGAPMRSNKRTADGRAERVAALRAALGDVDHLMAGPPPAGAKRDDVLDAMVGAWTARRYLAGTHLALGGGEVDERGLRMEILA
jgi:predicted RNase H-like nuclease